MEANCSGERIPKYEEALGVSTRGFSVIYKRDISEIYVNTHNKEWIMSWNGNLDIQPCFDYFAVIFLINGLFEMMLAPNPTPLWCFPASKVKAMHIIVFLGHHLLGLFRVI